MTLNEKDIIHKNIGGHLICTIRGNLQKREEIQERIDQLKREIPEGIINGPAFCIFHFIHSYSSGFDAEVGFPVSAPYISAQAQTRTLPQLEVLAKIHNGHISTKAESSGVLFGSQTEYGIISDEFTIEIYLDDDNAFGEQTELQFIVHRWPELYRENLERVLDVEDAGVVLEGVDKIEIETPAAGKFKWLKNSIITLDTVTDEYQKFDILSCCSHIFPAEQIAKQKAVYDKSFAEHGDRLQAIDAVLAFMDADPGWRSTPVRDGYTLHITKQPANPEAYEQARTELERRRAYCFCPLIRDHLDEGMPDTFCYCSSGWFRKQWEGATGKPVQVEIVRSLLKGHDVCEFAVHISEK